MDDKKKDALKEAAEAAGKTVEEVAKKVTNNNNNNTGSNQPEKKEETKPNKPGFGEKLKKATIQNPSFWLTAGKAVLKLVKAINDSEWYGGEDTYFTYPSGLAVKVATEKLAVGAFARYIADVDQLINIEMFEADLKNIVKSYLTSVGREYTAEEVSTHVTNMLAVMKADTKGLSVVECYLRYTNSRSVPITERYTLEDIMTADSHVSIGGNAMDPRCDNVGGLRRRSYPVRYSSISNDEWSTHYRPKIGQFYTNSRIRGLINYLYGSFFAGDVTTGVNGNIYVDHSAFEKFTGQQDTMRQHIDACLAEHERIMEADVLLDELLSYIGWYQVGTDDHFKRDQLACTYKLNADPEFVAALNNGDLMVNTSYAGGLPADTKNIGRYQGSTDKFVMLIPDGDISMSYSKDDLTTQLSLGLIGEYMKFSFMKGHWADMVLLQNDNGVVSIPNYTETQKMIKCYNHTCDYKVVDVAMGAAALSSRLKETRNLLMDKTGLRTWQDYLGLQDTADYAFNYTVTTPNAVPNDTNVGVEAMQVYGTTSDASRWVEPAGCAVVELNNYAQVKKLICNNFTLGVNFYEKAQIALRKFATAAQHR